MTKPYTRTKDLAYVAKCIDNNDCCMLVGISNIGKSTVIKQIRRPDILDGLLRKTTSEQLCFVHIDLNMQLQMTERAFYELVLRYILIELRRLSVEDHLIKQVEEAHQQVVAPTDEFQNAFSFNQTIINLCENWSKRLILLFDEFDEVFNALEKRVFLNLRALHDRYSHKLMYVVAVDEYLTANRPIKEIGEFTELFAHKTYYINPLDKKEVQAYVAAFCAENGVTFSEDDVRFIYLQSGGHPGLMEATCKIMADDTVEGVARNERILLHHLTDNYNIRTECVKLWQGLTDTKRDVLLTFTITGKIKLDYKLKLLQQGILKKMPDGVVIFSGLFTQFVRRKAMILDETEYGIVIDDVEGGQIYVDGRPIEESLTKLEYRLILLLYGHLNQVCDKYRIVEAVWGEDYVDEVYDTRIDKLVARLRQKIEKDPARPQHILTVWGRGYSLINRPVIES